jgi:hypothetical protein
VNIGGTNTWARNLVGIKGEKKESLLVQAFPLILTAMMLIALQHCHSHGQLKM